MKIQAVVPTRSGSKSVPNKNIRIFAGNPFVVYAIANALALKYMANVIVRSA